MPRLREQGDIHSYDHKDSKCQHHILNLWKSDSKTVSRQLYDVAFPIVSVAPSYVLTSLWLLLIRQQRKCFGYINSLNPHNYLVREVIFLFTSYRRKVIMIMPRRISPRAHFLNHYSILNHCVQRKRNRLQIWPITFITWKSFRIIFWKMIAFLTD